MRVLTWKLVALMRALVATFSACSESTDCASRLNLCAPLNVGEAQGLVLGRLAGAGWAEGVGGGMSGWGVVAGRVGVRAASAAGTGVKRGGGVGGAVRGRWRGVGSVVAPWLGAWGGAREEGCAWVVARVRDCSRVRVPHSRRELPAAVLSGHGVPCTSCRGNGAAL